MSCDAFISIIFVLYTSNHKIKNGNEECVKETTTQLEIVSVFMKYKCTIYIIIVIARRPKFNNSETKNQERSKIEREFPLVMLNIGQSKLV